MTRRPLFTAAILVIAAGALALRLPHLVDRPMHNDEGVNAAKFQEVYEHGTFHYDPSQYHGPAFWYLTLPIAWLSGKHTWVDLTEFNYRLLPVACGVGVVLTLLLLRRALGFGAAAWAALFVAVSPTMVYYSRDYIHEMTLVLFTATAIACGWRWSHTGRLRWALLCGACLGGMHATKETSFVIGAAMVCGLLLSLVWARYGERETPGPRRWLNKRHLSAALVTSLLVSVAFYSSFFRDLGGLKAAAAFFSTYASRASGQIGHVQPAGYYAKLLLYQGGAPVSPIWPGRASAVPWWGAKWMIAWWGETLIVAISLIGAIAVLFFKPIDEKHAPFQRFVVFYTFALFAAYSLISYKTPWNVLCPLHGMILLAGIGAAAIVRTIRRVPLKAIPIVLMAFGAAHLAWQAWNASTVHAADLRNPFVYAQTTPDALKLVELLETLAGVSPQGRSLGIQLGTSESYWPLPWYLRRFDHLYLYDTVPPPAAASVVIVSSDLNDHLDARIRDSDRYEPVMRGLRPGYVLSVYIAHDLWAPYLAERAKLRAAAIKPPAAHPTGAAR